jgi:hypothetical protein
MIKRALIEDIQIRELEQRAGDVAGHHHDVLAPLPGPQKLPQPEPLLRRPRIRPDFETSFVPPPPPQPPMWPPNGFRSQDHGEVPRRTVELQGRITTATQSIAGLEIVRPQESYQVGLTSASLSRWSKIVTTSTASQRIS